MAINKNELANIKKILQKIARRGSKYDYSKFIDGLKEHYNRIRVSEGGYATVIIPFDKKYTIKIIDKGSNPGYTAYARFCMKWHRKFSNLPKIYAMFTSNGYEFFIIEKLFHNITQSHRFEIVYNKYTNGMLYKHHKFYPLFEQINKRFGECGDVGGNNVMFRTNGTAVLTDPIAD